MIYHFLFTPVSSPGWTAHASTCKNIPAIVPPQENANICSCIISDDAAKLRYAKGRMDATALPQEDTPVGHTPSDLCFDKQHLGMQTRAIRLDNVNLCIEILIRDDPAPAERSSLKRRIP